jgi:hypothetical protein
MKWQNMAEEVFIDITICELLLNMQKQFWIYDMALAVVEKLFC